MTYAVTGATGQLGRLVVQKLKSKVPPAEIVGLVRSPAKGADLGVTLREADYSKPETLAAALKGVSKLLLISSSEIGQRAAQHKAVIGAAKTAGVSHIVYTSLLHADTSPLNLAPEHVETEAEIKASSLPYTFLRNGWYHENTTASAKAAVAAGALIGAAGDGRISGAARADYADAAVAALVGEGHAGKTYELAGDTAYSRSDVAAELSRQSGKTIPYKNLPQADYAHALASFGLPQALAEALASWDVLIANDILIENNKALSKLIGRPTTPLAAAVEAALR
jgi:NAD(P)H dehydrogenase (quinone)